MRVGTHDTESVLKIAGGARPSTGAGSGLKIGNDAISLPGPTQYDARVPQDSASNS